VSHGMATLRGKVVLFGGNMLQGSTYVLFSDTWEWDGSVWTKRDVPGPVPRVAMSMASR
jgi:hypothetical protein